MPSVIYLEPGIWCKFFLVIVVVVACSSACVVQTHPWHVDIPSVGQPSGGRLLQVSPSHLMRLHHGELALCPGERARWRLRETWPWLAPRAQPLARSMTWATRSHSGPQVALVSKRAGRIISKNTDCRLHPPSRSQDLSFKPLILKSPVGPESSPIGSSRFGSYSFSKGKYHI